MTDRIVDTRHGDGPTVEVDIEQLRKMRRMLRQVIPLINHVEDMMPSTYLKDENRLRNQMFKNN